MSFLFGSSGSLPSINQPVTSDTAEVKEAARLEAERMKKRKGYRSTILTGPQGVEENPTLLKTTLG
ncbi:MAG: hypothetical protein ABIA66_00190 [Candidatus Omnitrophota bacterium]